MGFLSFLTSKKEFTPGDGLIYNQRPLNLNISPTGASQVISVTFQKEVAFTFFYLRVVPTGQSISIYGDEYGGRQLTSDINFIGRFSVSNVVGSPTITSVMNVFSLDITNNLFFFNEAPWRTRNLYIQFGGAGQYIINLAYVF